MSTWYAVIEKAGQFQVVPSCCDACARGEDGRGHFACSAYRLQEGEREVYRAYCEVEDAEEIRDHYVGAGNHPNPNRSTASNPLVSVSPSW